MNLDNRLPSRLKNVEDGLLNWNEVSFLKGRPGLSVGVNRGLVHNRRHQTRRSLGTSPAGGGGDGLEGRRTFLHVAVNGIKISVVEDK